MPASPLPPDPYKALGVAKDADIAAIKSAHRKLVLKCHPDKFPDEAQKAAKAEEFHLVQQAYELLSDDKNRERYDAQVRLAELKAERFREEAANPSPRRQESVYKESAYSPRPTAQRSWTTSSPIFEEIRPKGASARYYEEPSRTESRQPPRHDDYRSPRDYEEEYDFIPAFGASKKGSSTTRAQESRAPETSTRVRGNWKNLAAKATEKAAKERDAEDRRKSRDKGRRDDGHSKREHVRIPMHGDPVSETDSEVESFMASSRRSDRPRSYEQDKHSRRKYEPRQNSPDHDARIQHHVQSAAEYIIKSGGRAKEHEPRRRPSISRSASSNRHQISPPPPPPPMPPAEDVSRSSARRSAVSSSKASKSSKRDMPEIVAPPSSRRRDHDDSKRPELHTSKTQPSKPPSRSATLETPRSDYPRGPVRRSATSPLAPLSAGHAHKSANSRDNQDSGHSSPGTPDAPRTKTTSYRVIDDPDSDADGRPRVFRIDPDRGTTREPSPRTSSYRSERSGASGSSRHGPSRSQTIDEPTSHHRPANLSRAATERPDRPYLYGEVRGSPDRAQYEGVRYSPRRGKDDINYGSVRRSPPIDRDSHTSEYVRRGEVPFRPSRTAQAAS